MGRLGQVFRLRPHGPVWLANKTGLDYHPANKLFAIESKQEKTQVTTRSLAVLFPGQGSQEPAMGKLLAEANSDCMELWTLAEKHSGLPLREIYWDGQEESDGKDMAATNALQPGLTAVNLGAWLAAKGKLDPAFAAGHSLGEYSALAASGTLAFEDALKLVCLRGRLMHEAGQSNMAGSDGFTEGSMAAIVKLNREGVEAIVAQAADETSAYLTVANYNTPAQHVISGAKAAVDAAVNLAKANKGRGIPLAVAGAFHSAMMAEAADEFARVLTKTDFKTPAFPVIFNVTASPENNPEAIKSLMARQLTESVRWTDSIQHMHAQGVGRYVELGPKNVLAKMVGQILGKDADFTAVSGGHTPESISSTLQGLEA